MKKLFSISCSIFIILTSCQAAKQQEKPIKPADNKIHSQPEWYKNQSLPVKPFEIIGYGEGVTKEQAANQARSEIAKTIKVKVASTSHEKTTFEQKKGVVTQDRISILGELSTSSQVELDDVKLIKSETVGKRVYVSLKYVNLPVPEKTKYSLDRSGGV